MQRKYEPNVNSNSLNGMFPIEHSDLYNFFIEEKNEILQNQIKLGEQMGHQVSFEYSMWDWHVRFRTKWIEKMIESGKYKI